MNSADIITMVSLVAQMVENLPTMQEPRFNPCMGKIPCRRERFLTKYSCLDNFMDRGT